MVFAKPQFASQFPTNFPVRAVDVNENMYEPSVELEYIPGLDKLLFLREQVDIKVDSVNEFTVLHAPKGHICILEGNDLVRKIQLPIEMAVLVEFARVIGP
jgi:hypothetical protein